MSYHDVVYELNVLRAEKLQQLAEARPIPLDQVQLSGILDRLFAQTYDSLEAMAAKGYTPLADILAVEKFTTTTVKGDPVEIKAVVKTKPSKYEDWFQGAYYNQREGYLVVNVKSAPARIMMQHFKGKNLRSIQGLVFDAFVHELTHAKDILPKLGGYVSPSDPVIQALVSLGVSADQIQTRYLKKKPAARSTFIKAFASVFDELQKQGPILGRIPEGMRTLSIIEKIPEWKLLDTETQSFLETLLDATLQDDSRHQMLQIQAQVVADQKNLEKLSKELFKKYVNQPAEVRAELQQFIHQANFVYQEEYTRLAALKKQERIPHLLRNIPLWTRLKADLEPKIQRHFMKALYQAFSTPVTPQEPLEDRLKKWKLRKVRN